MEIVDGNLKEVDKELKKRKALNWVKEKAEAVKETTKKVYKENETVIKTYILPAMLPVVGMTIKSQVKARNNRIEEKERKCRHWDPTTFEWVYSRRPLKPKEQNKLDELYDKGRGLSKREALRKMGLLG